MPSVIPEAGPWSSEYEKSRYDLDFLNLNEKSIVLDFGAYVGEWADTISKKYNCKVISYEPIDEYCNEIENLLNPNITVVRKAVGIFNGSETIILAGESSSIDKYGRTTNPSHKGSPKTENYNTVEIEVINIDNIMSEFDLIDVIKINTEGSEYDLLNHLIETKDIQRIKYIQVQFHSFVENATEMYEDIKRKLNNTHELVLDSRWKWSYWMIKK